MVYRVAQFQYQEKTDPIVVGGEIIFENKWHFPWSEPVKTRFLAIAQHPAFFASESAQFAQTVSEDRWHQPWSEPLVKAKQGLGTGNQQFLAFQFPFVTMPWFNWLSEPVRFRPQLITADQPYVFPELLPPSFFNMAWFNWLSEPVRLPIGLRKDLQREAFLNPFIPIQYAASLQGVELGDFLNAVLRQFAPPIKAIVTIVAPPGPPGYSAVITPNVPPLPGARVAIITTKGL